MAMSMDSVCQERINMSNLRRASDEERKAQALARIRAYETRPSTVAAEAFFGGNDVHKTLHWETLPQRVHELCRTLEQWDAENGSPELSCSFSQDPREARRQCMTAAIMARADARFLKAFQKLFQHSLLERDTHSAEEGFFCHLRTLGWIRPQGLLQQPLIAALRATILKWVRTTISKNFEEESLFQKVQEYQDTVVLPWLKDLVGSQRFEQDDWTLKVQFTCAECYCLVRNDEIFELVAEYPDSQNAVTELKQVLEHTKMYSSLGHALKQSLIRRLNHPGAETNQIIDVYINTIKVLREIDPSDRLLQVVAEPVRTYLRRRHNTVRCIITSLTDAEVGGELYEELRRQDARPLDHNTADSDEEEDEPSMDWQPPPPIAKKKGGFFDNINMGGSSSGANGGDILSILVSIYGSKELFVNEYRIMLADKLLANLDFNTDKEVHTLELLKLRFGELSMRNCEIMIKDTDDSKRVNANIHSTLQAKERRRQQLSRQEQSHDPTIFGAAIVSHIFWPALQNEPFKHHPRLQAGLDKFGAEYGRLKNPRRLVWLNQLGTVQLELDILDELEDGTTAVATREFTVSPLLATLISYFEDKVEWTAEQLSNETGLPEHTIQKRMGYWVGHRVLQLHPPATYTAATRDYLLAGGEGSHSVPIEDDGHHLPAVSVAAQQEEDFAIYESYISGMLNTHGQLPLERIHNMLKMFVTGSDIKYNKTPQQLSRLLQHLCKQDKLECGPDGMYKLVKK